MTLTVPPVRAPSNAESGAASAHALALLPSLERGLVMVQAEVADRLAALRDATDADELLVTTITHDHDDRVRSFQLLAKEWSQR